MKSRHRQAKLYNLYVRKEPEMILSLPLPLLGSQSMMQLQHSNCIPSTNKTASPSYIEVSAPVCRMVPSRAVYLPIMPFPGTVIAGVLCLFAHTLHWVQKWHETNADLHFLHQHLVHFQCPHSPGLQLMIHNISVINNHTFFAPLNQALPSIKHLTGTDQVENKKPDLAGLC